MRATHALAAAAAGLALVLAAPASAVATPFAEVEVATLGALTLPFDVTGAAPGTTDVTFRRIDIAPGGSTGWHYHDGPVYALVAAGTLTRVLADCSTVTSPAGSVVEEVWGEDELHVGENRGDTTLTLFVVYAVPGGVPLAHTAPAPSCP